MAIAGSVTIIGVDAVIRKIKASEARLRKAATDSLKEAGKDIIAEAQSNTPHDTGNLKGSAFVDPHIQQTSKGLLQEIGYTATYAIFVHEIDKNYRRGGWKFLSNAMNVWEGLALELFEKRLRAML